MLVTIDTLRADHLGAYGHRPATSPFIDGLAAESLLFERVDSTAPSTAPSIASLMTGAHRATHGVRGNGGTLPERVTTLAEILRAHGFHTAARIANPLLDVRVGFAQGFDDFAMPAGLSQLPPAVLDGAPVVADAQRLIAAAGDSRLFLWLHFFDPHGPYFPPETYRARFDRADYRWPGDRELLLSEAHYGPFLVPRYQAIDHDASPASYRARYDAEIRYADDHVRAVVEALRADDEFERTLFVLTADHGESLGERDFYFQHGFLAYDHTVHVPLLIRSPGLPRGHRIAQSVSLVDVAPTILDLLGIEPGAEMEGRSLRGLFDGAGANRLAFAQSYFGTGSVLLRSGSLEYVFRPARSPSSPTPAPDELAILPAEPQHELYDLATDPTESHNLASSRPGQLAALQQHLRTWLLDQHQRGERHLQPATEAGAPSEAPGLDPIVESQLRALGYLR